MALRCKTVFGSGAFSKWVEQGDPIVVAEDEIGAKLVHRLFFPRVQTCTAVVACTDAHVNGFHYTVGTSADAIWRLCKKLEEVMGHKEIVELWLIGGMCTRGEGWSHSNPQGVALREAFRALFTLPSDFGIHYSQHRDGVTRFLQVWRRAGETEFLAKVDMTGAKGAMPDVRTLSYSPLKDVKVYTH